MALVFLAGLLVTGLARSDCRAAAPSEVASKKPEPSDPEKSFGIRILSLRPTAEGQMLDLRFRVVDPEKAKAVLDKGKKAYLLDAKTGKTLTVPVTKAGPMRQTTLNPEAGRVYFMLFANPGGMVKVGGSVSLIIGDFRKDHISVDASGSPPPAAQKPPQE
jgi:hypothetical protein